MRDKINQQFTDMLARETIPIFEEQTIFGTLTIEVFRDNYGILFDYSFECDFDYNQKPYFDDAIQKRHGMYYVSWAEIDRSFNCLNNVLQFIHNNVMDGIVCAYNLYPAESE